MAKTLAASSSLGLRLGLLGLLWSSLLVSKATLPASFVLAAETRLVRVELSHLTLALRSLLGIASLTDLIGLSAVSLLLALGEELRRLLALTLALIVV